MINNSLTKTVMNTERSDKGEYPPHDNARILAIVALISNLMNNLPVGLIGANALQVAHFPVALILCSSAH